MKVSRNLEIRNILRKRRDIEIFGPTLNLFLPTYSVLPWHLQRNSATKISKILQSIFTWWILNPVSDCVCVVSHFHIRSSNITHCKVKFLVVRQFRHVGFGMKNLEKCILFAESSKERTSKKFFSLNFFSLDFGHFDGQGQKWLVFVELQYKGVKRDAKC